MKKILYLTEDLSPQLDGGGSIKTWRTVKTLAKKYQVLVLTLVSHQKKFPTTKNITIKKVIDPSISLPIKNRIPQLFKEYLRGNPYYFFQYQNEKFKKLVTQSITNFKPDVIHVDHLNMAQYLPTTKTLPWVYEEHNLEHQLRLDMARFSKKIGYHWLIWLGEAVLLYFKEKHFLRKMDAVFTISDRDNKLLKARFGQEIKTHTFRPPLIPHSRKKSRKNPPENVPPRLLFVGNLEWLPNKLALEWFFRNIFPSLIPAFPKISLHVVGKGKNMVKIPKNFKNYVHFHGYQKNISPFFKKANCFILPFLFGEGVRIKALTALGFGVPPISTPAGLRGLEHLRKHPLVHLATNETEFRQQLQAILKEKKTPPKTSLLNNFHGKKNRDAFLKKYQEIMASRNQ